MRMVGVRATVVCGIIFAFGAAAWGQEKDAVKLESLWPAEAGSLWYVSQRLRIEDGQMHIDRLLDSVLSSVP